MLKKEIIYTDFDGEDQVETVLFNLTKTELVNFELEYPDGFGKHIESAIAAGNTREVVLAFQKLVLIAFGERSEDGKRFIKSDELREEFTQTAAYDALFTELATDEGAAKAFMLGVMPSDLSEVAEKALNDG